MTHEAKCEKHKKFVFEGCPVDICEDITVKVPVTVCAHSEVCDASFKCMGHTIENVDCDDSQSQNKECHKFNVIQKINVHIPLKFIAECDVAKGLVDFDLHDCSKHDS